MSLCGKIYLVEPEIVFVESQFSEFDKMLLGAEEIFRSSRFFAASRIRDIISVIPTN